MNFTDPDNSALDALYDRAATHPEDRPALLQALLEHELYTLIPRGQSTRPADQVQRPAPGRKLHFPRWKTDTGEYFFVYTSARYARRGAQKYARAASGPFLIFALPGEALLQRLALPGMGVCLNPGSGKTELLFNDLVLHDLLDGTLFTVGRRNPEPPVRGSVRPLPVEEHPLVLVQPVFDHLKTRPEVMAAWVLAPDMYWEKGERFYLFGLLTTAEDTAALCRSTESVLGLVEYNQRAGLRFAVTILEYADPAHAAMMREFPPFYQSPEYRPAAQP